MAEQRISTAQFQEFAGNDASRWRLLVGCMVRHKIYGRGEVLEITSASAPLMKVSFEQPQDGRAERAFAACGFGEFFDDLELPPAEVEQVHAALHAQAAQPVMRSGRSGEIIPLHSTGGPHASGKARESQPGLPASPRPVEKKSAPAEKMPVEVRCPYCVFMQQSDELAEHIRITHPSRYPEWRSRHQPPARPQPAQPGQPKVVIVGQTPGASQPSPSPDLHPQPARAAKPSEPPQPAGVSHSPDRLPAPAFQPGQQVVVRKDPSRRGVVTQKAFLVGGEYQYEVFFSAGQAHTYRESDLALPEAAAKWGRFDELLRNLALVKQNKPLSDNLYALYGSRTQFEVYQFKPALKFLGNPDGRLLIADEVGLGKTIEAGIIYLELQARLALNRVLVVCPSGLRIKWQDELKLRFDEEFVILDTEGLRRFFHQYKQYGENARLRGIVSLEALRREEIAEIIEQERILFDLVIIDEAHHCRNTGTLSHRIASLLSENADAMLLLTATPLQIGNQDLFNLLRILSPGEFDDFGVFEARLEPNQYINRAAQILATGDHPRALAELRKVEKTSQKRRFTGNPYYSEIVRLLGQSFVPRIDLVAAQRRLIELNTLAYIFTRTRKREIAEKAPVRAAFVLPVQFTREEELFYNQLVEAVRQEFALLHGNLAVGWASIMRERQAASCISAARRRFGELVDDLNSEEESFFDSAILGEVDPGQVRSHRSGKKNSLLKATAAARDTKFQCFIEALVNVLGEDKHSKVIVFSFFRDTIEYLYEQLGRLGIDALRLHGGFKVPDRQVIIDKFRASPNIRVLISSDVGAEGLDFQFCNTLFNYDLPWNPMKVEQRIGRIDRFGQQSARIRIYNLVIENSVESRIMMRLYERIGLFERAVGDIEAILGDEIRELSKKVYTARLTPEEETRLADQAAGNILRRQQELEEFEQKRLQFMGQEAIFSTLVSQTIESGSFVSDIEVRSLVETYLAEAFKGHILPEPNGDGSYALTVTDDLAARLTDFIMKVRRNDLTAQDFLRSLAPGKVLPLTYTNELAYERKLLHFITLRHPLAQAALQYWRERVDPATMRLYIGLKTNAVRPGNYFFFVYVLESHGAEPSTRLVPVVVLPGECDVYSDLSNQFLRLVQTCAYNPPGPEPELASDDWEAAVEQAQHTMAIRRDEIEAEIQRANDAIVNARLEALESSYQAKHQRVKDAEANATDQRIRNMRRGQLRNLEARHRLRRQEIEAQREVSVSFHLALKGYVIVTEA